MLAVMVGWQGGLCDGSQAAVSVTCTPPPSSQAPAGAFPAAPLLEVRPLLLLHPVIQDSHRFATPALMRQLCCFSQYTSSME